MSRCAHKPIRTCIGCGERAAQAELLCLTSAPDGSVDVVDPRRRSGRTGYLHRRVGCWERFAARKGPIRSLGRAADKHARAAVVQRLKAIDASAMMR